MFLRYEAFSSTFVRLSIKFYIEVLFSNIGKMELQVIILIFLTEFLNARKPRLVLNGHC